MNSARSRLPTHGSSGSFSDSSSSRSASSTVSGFGAGRLMRGPEKVLIAGLCRRPSRSSQRKRLRTDDRARDRLLEPIPFMARWDSQERKSVTVSAARSFIDGGFA